MDAVGLFDESVRMVVVKLRFISRGFFLEVGVYDMILKMRRAEGPIDVGCVSSRFLLVERLGLNKSS